MELIEWARLQEELLKAQLSVIRTYVRHETPDINERKISERQSKSHMSIIVDILSSAGTPLHISEIIRQTKEQYGTVLDRESAVSALTKKVKKGTTFIRTAPNTFGLK